MFVRLTDCLVVCVCASDGLSDGLCVCASDGLSGGLCVCASDGLSGGQCVCASDGPSVGLCVCASDGLSGGLWGIPRQIDKLKVHFDTRPFLILMKICL